jgi:hypothetical protein
MPKPNIAELVQSPLDQAVIIDLAANEVAVVTGTMNGCVSVVVLWNPVNGVFQNVRGHHAGGGPGNIDWAQLLQGVPLDQNTLIVMAHGDSTTEYDVTNLRAAVGQHPGTRRSFVKHSNCYIDRKSPNPTMREIDTSEYAKYNVRRGTSII